MSRAKVLVADPPWQFSDKLAMSKVKRGAEANYATLPIADLLCLPIGRWTLPDSICALWVPSALLPEGLTVLAEWGYVFKQVFTWVKTTQSGGLAFGMGRQFRNATEHALIGTRGKVQPASKSERNVILSPATPHSQKPEELQEALERMYPEGPFLELFARRVRLGWTCVGNECPTTLGADLREWTYE